MAMQRTAALPEVLADDLVLEVLLRSEPREVCRLECCCRSLRRLADNQVWKHIFLLRRHANALCDPPNWKQEYARRESVSRGWCSLNDTASPSPKVKIKMMVMKVMSFSTRIMPNPSPVGDTLFVDGSPSIETPSGAFRSINEALARCKPFDRIRVAPGRYCERLALDKPVEIIGSVAEPGTVLLGGPDGPTVDATGRFAARVVGLRIEQCAGAAATMTGAVHVRGGATLVVEECRITSQIGHCVIIQGPGSSGHILHNVVSRGKGVGVLASNQATGLIEDNDILGNGRAGVAILSGADPRVLSNKIHSGMDSGIMVSDKGRGIIERNDIFANRRAGVAIQKEGAPFIRGNKIHDGRDSGVLVFEDGQGCVIENDIFANQMAAVAVGGGCGSCRISGNTIRDNGSSLCLSPQSKGLISANIIVPENPAPASARWEEGYHRRLNAATANLGAVHEEMMAEERLTALEAMSDVETVESYMSDEMMTA